MAQRAVRSLRFNQDQGCFTCCLNTGLRVYNVDPLVEKTHYSSDEIGSVLLCEMVQRSNWLLVVRRERPRRLMLLDDTQRLFRAEVTFGGDIRLLRARIDKVAVVLDNSIHILSLPGLSRIALLRTPSSQRPLCALAAAPQACTQLVAACAYTAGSLQLLDVSSLTTNTTSISPTTLSCHKAPLACISLSHNGSRLATASMRGTLLRVWETATRTMLYELRRGSDAADLYCINFDSNGKLLCAVSDKGTLHVWRLGQRLSSRHLATARASPDQRTICAFVSETSFVAICEDGTFHKYTYSESGCHRDYFDYFLQVGDDDDFIQ